MTLARALLLLLVTQAPAEVQRAPAGGAPQPPTAFRDNLCLSKGGVGILRRQLYVAVKSRQNELLLDEGGRWTGRESTAREVAVVFDGKVWSQDALPEDFDLGKAIVVSFEGDKIRFYDFGEMKGGYYRRSAVP